VASPTQATQPKGRLYRAIGASGEQAEMARLAVAKRSDLADGVAIDDLMNSKTKKTSRSTKTAKSKQASKGPASGLSLNLAAIVLLVILLPIVIGVAESLLTGQIGLVTNVSFAVLVVVSAVFARKGEYFSPAVAGPIGYFLMLTLTSVIELLGAGVWPRITAFIVLELGVNAPWLLLPAAAAALIGLIKWSAHRRATALKS
jgi:hypothetical protein